MMRCPQKNLIIDYLEGELESDLAAQVREHVAGCVSCRAELEALLRVRKLLSRVRYLEPDEPDESFWRKNVELVAKATFKKQGQAHPTGKVLAFPSRKLRILSAAAVVLIVLAGVLKWGLGPAGSRETAEALVLEESSSALLDSLVVLSEDIYRLDMTAMVLEAISKLQEDSLEFPPGGITFPTGRSVYEGLLELEDEELQQVMLVLAGY